MIGLSLVQHFAHFVVRFARHLFVYAEVGGLLRASVCALFASKIKVVVSFPLECLCSILDIMSIDWPEQGSASVQVDGLPSALVCTCLRAKLRF